MVEHLARILKALESVSSAGKSLAAVFAGFCSPDGLIAPSCVHAVGPQHRQLTGPHYLLQVHVQAKTLRGLQGSA